MGLPYFEVEILTNEGTDSPNNGTMVGIGLCGEFDCLRGISSGWLNGTVGYHGDGTVIANGKTVGTIGTYAEGRTIGCGVNWKDGSFYFTLNGRVICKHGMSAARNMEHC